MAFPTAVNSQITDSATTQTDPAALVAQVYQALAQSTGALFEITASAQQQLLVGAQAAMTEGANRIFDAGGTAPPADKVAQSDVPDTLLSLLAALRAKQADTAAAIAERAHDCADADDARVAHAVREAASALEAAIDATGRALRTSQLDILRNAALAATLAAVIRNPGQAGVYAPLLQIISELD